MSVEIRPARPGEAGLVLNFVRELAAYEKLADEVEADEGAIHDALFAGWRLRRLSATSWNGDGRTGGLRPLVPEFFFVPEGATCLYLGGHFSCDRCTSRARHRPRHPAGNSR